MKCSLCNCSSMNGTIEVRVLGPTAVKVDGRPVELGSLRQRRLLAALAIDAGSVVSADRLADRVWADGELPEDPRRALRTYLARLRQALAGDEAIVTEPSGWRLDEFVVDVDANRFTELVDGTRWMNIDVHQRLARLDKALDLWRGEAFEDAVGEEWVRADVDRLNELRITAVERRYDAMLEAGMHTDALPGLAGEVDTHPLRDRLVGLQMLAMFRSGRQAEATRVFQAHRHRLADELGLAPGAELVELDRRIVAGDPSLQLTSTAGRPLRGYRLGEQIGEGAFAVVYPRDSTVAWSRCGGQNHPPRVGQQAGVREAVRSRGPSGGPTGTPLHRAVVRLLARTRPGMPRFPISTRRHSRVAADLDWWLVGGAIQDDGRRRRRCAGHGPRSRSSTP